MSGQLVEYDESKAFDYYRQGAAIGSLRSAYYVGLFYSWGRIVTKDDAEAEYWWRAAASGGYADAQLSLGRLYLESGDDTAAVEGIFWLEQAGASGNGEAYIQLAQYYSSIPIDDLDRAYAYAQLASRSPDPRIADEGLGLMKSLARMKDYREQHPRQGRL